MHFSTAVGVALLSLASATTANFLPKDHILWGPKGPQGAGLIRRQASSTSSAAPTTTSKAADGSCSNGPFSRGCWSNGFSIATDFDEKWPTTGKTVSYNLEITNGTCNPDGNGERKCLLVNGQYPAPTISCNWGDRLSITVKNSMPDNGTSIHWHGIRQLNSNTEDGVNGITECPLAPEDTKTYNFQATQFGTSWYHSHFSAQYGDGIVGAIVINGPATSNYDLDLGPFPLTDWYYRGAFEIESLSDQNFQLGGGPPSGDNILVNGTNKNAAGGGAYGRTIITQGKKYRLRIINTSVDAQLRVSLDGHAFTVITSDFVPIKPYVAQTLLLAIGQRYDVIITANNTASNYWFRAEVQGACASANKFKGRSIFSYAGAPTGEPTTTAFATPGGCEDADGAALTPWVPNSVPSADFLKQAKNLDVNIHETQLTTNEQNIVVWGINMTGIDIDWRKPTLEYVKTGNSSYPQAYNMIEIPQGQTWTYWIIQETDGEKTKIPIPHPMHLHGHDFYTLGKGEGIFNKDTDTAKLNFNNPTRRDVTFLPARGWVVIAFPTDNPGAWLMHCHIAWHVSEGLGVQFLERKNEIKLPDANWDKTCANWQKYYNGSPAWLKEDSGL